MTLILPLDRVQILLRPGPTLRAPLSPQRRRARRLEGKVIDTHRDRRQCNVEFPGFNIREALSRPSPGSDFKPHWKHTYLRDYDKE